MKLRDVIWVAHYERKMLARGGVFIFLALTLVITITCFHVCAHSGWRFLDYRVNISSAIPCTNAYVYCILQSFGIIFIAGNFLRRDSVLSSNDAFLVRPVGNASYLVGKGLAVIELFLMVNVVVIVLTSVIHGFASDSVFQPLYYLFYFITLTFPALMFMTAGVLAVRVFVKSQGVALFLLLVYYGGSLLVLPFVLHGVFDYMALGVPNTFSLITGYPSIGSYLLQRMIFLCAAGGLIALAVKGLPRFSNELHLGVRVVRFALFAWGLTLLFGFLYLYPFGRLDAERQRYASIYRKFNACLKVNTVAHEIHFRRDGDRFRATSFLSLENRNTGGIDSLIFYLNPGLEMTRLSLENEELPFRREGQVVVVRKNLEPGRRVVAEMTYEGKIDQAICYPEVDTRRYASVEREDYFLNFGHYFAFLGGQFTLLTPECLWYPVSLPVVDLDVPLASRREFTDYTLRVIPSPGEVFVSQGEKTFRGDTVLFKNVRPLFGIVLVGGDFVKDSVRPDSVTVEFYNVKGHSALSGALNASEEGRKAGCHDILEKIRVKSSYPSTRLALVETPLSFFSFPRSWRLWTDRVHFEMLLIPEQEDRNLVNYPDLYAKSLEEGENSVFFPATRERIEDYMIDEKYYFVSPPRNTDYLVTLLQDHHILVTSPKYPFINQIIQVLNTDFWDQKSSNFGFFMTKVHDDLKAMVYLDRSSLKDALNDPDARDILPGIIRRKGMQLQDYIFLGTSREKFRAFMDEFMTRNAFREVTFLQFAEQLNEALKVDIGPFVESWFVERGVPSFIVRDVNTSSVRENNHEKEFLKFKIWNRGKVDGIVSLLTRFDDGNFMPFDGKLKNVLIPAGASYEICYPAGDSIPSITNGKYYQLAFGLNMNHSMNIPEGFQPMRALKSFRVKEMTVNRIDTALFLPSSGEILVDDDDPGFSIKHEGIPLLKKWRNRENEFVLLAEGVPTQWSRAIGAQGYGDVFKSYHCKGAGSGKSEIEWRTVIEKSGSYELFVYIPIPEFSMMTSNLKEGRVTWGYHAHEYTFFHGDQEEQIVLDFTAADVKNRNVCIRYSNGSLEDKPLPFMYGWISVGTYFLSEGEVRLVLHDNGLPVGQVLVADAVKWVKVE